MNRFVATVFIVSASMHFSYAANAQKTQATLEFCLAQNTPTDNWTKRSLLDTSEAVFVSPEPVEAVFVSPEPVLTGRDIKKVSFSKDDKGHPTIGFTFTGDGSAKMWTATSQNIGKRLAILLDRKVVSAPTIQSGIKKEAVISGSFDNDDLLKFFTAIVLRDASNGN